MNKGFNLIAVITIVIITSIVSAVTTGIILNNNYKGNSGLSYAEIMNDEDLAEFINIYSTIISEYYDQVDTTGMLNSASEALKSYSGSDKDEMLKIATEAMLAYLGDDYTTYLNDDQSNILNNQLDSSYQGIGVSIKGSQIITVFPDSPAEKAGILPNDIIYKVDEVLINEENEPLISYFITQSENEYANITVKRAEELIEFKIKKEKLDASVQSQVIAETNIGYISVDVFSEEVTESFSKNLINLEKESINSLIIDLRYNTGGYLNGATEIASLFLEKGEIIYSLENKDGKEDIKDKTDESRSYDIIILMNEESASASEILAAALVDSYGAKIVGTQSYGKGKVQQTLTTSEGLVAKYTSAKWYTPNGICIDEIGIEPDYEIEIEYILDSEGKIESAIDKQYEKAIELLK